MLKYYSIIIGENPKYTSSFQPAGKRKIALYANCLMIPVLLWFINGYMLARNVLESTFVASVITALVSAIVIFLVERAILMCNGSRAIFWFRIVLGFVIASLGAISLDEVVFKQDIDNQIEKHKADMINIAADDVSRQFEKSISTQELLVSQRATDWGASLDDAKRESDGTGGSKQKKVGMIAIFKMGIAKRREIEYEKESHKLDSLRYSLELNRNAAKLKANANFNGHALLMRIKALFNLVSSDTYMRGIYILFTVLMFCLEFLVVLIKASSKFSIDEELEKARDQILRTRTQKILAQNERYFQPESSTPEVQRAKAILSGNFTSIF
jgi:hypothetical protein